LGSLGESPARPTGCSPCTSSHAATPPGRVAGSPSALSPAPKRLARPPQAAVTPCAPSSPRKRSSLAGVSWESWGRPVSGGKWRARTQAMVGGKAVRVHCGYFHDEAAAGRAAAAEAARQGVKALREETRQRAEETRRRERKERAELMAAERKKRREADRLAAKEARAQEREAKRKARLASWQQPRVRALPLLPPTICSPMPLRVPVAAVWCCHWRYHCSRHHLLLHASCRGVQLCRLRACAAAVAAAAIAAAKISPCFRSHRSARAFTGTSPRVGGAHTPQEVDASAASRKRPRPSRWSPPPPPPPPPHPLLRTAARCANGWPPQRMAATVVLRSCGASAAAATFCCCSICQHKCCELCD
jgi:hypothetical protein